ncbi:MAG: glycosyltransferase [Janthinobacterium lividum]
MNNVVPSVVTGMERIRVLHSVGHLSRGGIETWLYGIVRRLSAPRYEHHVMVWTDTEEAFTAEFRAAGVRVHALPGHANPLRFVLGFRQLVQKFGPFDVLHTHGTQFDGFVLALGKAFGIPVRIAHSHTDITPVLRNSKLAYRAYAAIGHGLIRSCATEGRGVSQVAALSMFGQGWQNDPRWKILFCGIDFDRFVQPPAHAWRAKLGIREGRFVLGHVGRFETQKNHAFLPDMMTALLARRANAHLLLVGDGSLRPAFEGEIVRRGLAEYVTILPDCKDVPGLMAEAMDAFVLPSLYEGLPLVLVEAQAAGLPCLVSDGLAAEAIVVSDSVRCLALCDGPKAWAEAASTLPGRISPYDVDLRETLRRSPFSLDRSSADLGALYESSIAMVRL